MALPIRIFIVDDHQMFREGVRSRLKEEAGMQIAGEASSGAEAIQKLAKVKADIVILDIKMEGLNGIETAKRMKDKWPNLKILVLTGYDFHQYVSASIKLGVDGYMLKDSPQDELVKALRDIADGGVVLPPKIASQVVRTQTSSAGMDGRKPQTLWDLTMRELDVLELLQQGYRNAEIARRLDISKRTVEVHVRHVMSKLEADNRMDAARIAQDNGILR